MKIALMHYHLKTGGVATVIREQAHALGDADAEAAVFTGDRAGADLPCPVIPVAGIGYDAEETDPPSAEETAGALLAALHRTWPRGPDLLHVHNPTLAKNRRLLSVLKSIQRRGVRLFLQIHDFAEDGRPGAYFNEPYVDDCHYGVLNDRDYRILRESGLTSAGLHLLPNPVSPLPAAPAESQTGSDPVVLYPVRAIRRKNIGEALLLSQFFHPPLSLCITRPPNSAADFPAYEHWKHFSNTHGLKVVFEAGATVDFASLVQRSAFMITTSIMEGFGFSFLEPWAAGKALKGRRLPGICRDFTENGVDLSGLYDRLAIPTDFFSMADFAKRWRAAVSRSLAVFGRPAGRAWLDAAFAALIQEGTIDFGLLDEPVQQTVLARIRKRSPDRTRMVKLNPALSRLFVTQKDKDRIKTNRSAVLQRYSRTQYQTRLLNTYRRVLNTAVSHSINRNELLSAFIRREAFSLLKWETQVPG